MSKKAQINKNLELSQKLLDYLADNPLGKNVSFVVISKDDNKLNKENLKIAKKISKQGKTVIAATETGNTSKPWEFNYL